MKKQSTLLCVGMILIAFHSFAQSRAYIPERTLYFDTLDQGAPCTKDFYIKNIGSEPLVVYLANTSCGCDMGTWPKDPIFPGDSGKINYKYDSKRIGLLNKSMTIKTNDTIEPMIVIRFKGYIRPKSQN